MKADSVGLAGWLLRVGVSFVSTLLFLSVTEFVVATLGIAPEQRESPPILYQSDGETPAGPDLDFAPHPDWLWEPRRDSMVYGGKINRGSYRGPFYPATKKGRKLRIATLGDSSTFGYRLPERQSWSRELERLIAKNGQAVEVLNFGCTGFSIEQGSALYRGRVRRYSPDVVIIAFGALNDALPATHGLADALHIEINHQYRSRLSRFLRRYASFRLFESSLAPGRAPDASDASEQSRVSLERFAELLERFRDDVASDGARLVVVSPPRRPDALGQIEKVKEYTDLLHHAAEKNGLPFVDVRRELRGVDRRELGPRFEETLVAERSQLFIDRWHPSPRGHRIYARAVLAQLSAAGIIPKSGVR